MPLKRSRLHCGGERPLGRVAVDGEHHPLERPRLVLRTTPTISRAASSSGKPPTPVPNATNARERQPSSSALRKVDRVARSMMSADVGPPSSIVAASIT